MTRSRTELRVWFSASLAILALSACGSGDAKGSDDAGGSSPVATTEETAWNYVALGGSIAAGAGSPYGTSYVDYYKDLIEEDTGTTVDVLDLSIGEGGTTQLVLDQLADPSTVEALEDAEIVTMEIGGNDLIAGDEPYFAGECEGLACYKGPERTFEKNYEEIVTRISSLVGDDTILRSVTFYNQLVGDPDGFGGPGFVKISTQVTEIMNAATCRISEAAGWVCVDVYPAFNGKDGKESPLKKGLLASDNTHPSEKGHRLIASLLQEAGYQPLR
jgi:lysophospholipase L1-like esterase